MNDTYYLVDHNAMIDLKRTRRATPFFKHWCRITTDVLHEARFLRDHSELQSLEYPMTPDVLELVRTLMQGLPVSAVNLIDLYKYKGTADPGLVASALDASRRNDGALFPYRWVIVSRDGGVRALAELHGVEVISPQDLENIVDASQVSP